MVTTAEFFEFLHGECMWFTELRILPGPSDGASRVWGAEPDVELVPKAMAASPTHNVYFGVCTRTGGGSKREDVQEAPAVWCDLDFKGMELVEAAKAIRGFPLPPSLIVATGGGWHLYWKLKEPALVEEFSRIESINRGLAKALGGDPASTDIARILRVPGTLNHKYDPPRTVTVIDQSSAGYSLSDFMQFESEEKPAAVGNQDGNTFVRMLYWCEFLRHCRDDAAALPENHWYAMISNLVRHPGGVTKAHEFSKPHKGYKPRETDRKILHAIDSSGPITCKKIREFFPACMDCRIIATAPCTITADPPGDNT